MGVDGLDLSVAVFDLLDANPPAYQPYDGLHAPLPLSGRELVFRVRVSR